MNFAQKDLWKSTNFAINTNSKDFKLAECSSADQFFKIKDRKNKYTLNFNRNFKPGQSFFNNKVKNCPQDIQFDEIKFPKFDQLTANTENISIDSKIQFRQKKTKVKINNVQSPKNSKIKTETKTTISSTQSLKNSSTIPKNRYKDVNRYVPKKLSDFNILKKVGQGNFSEVFVAIQKNIGFLCCLKKMQKKSIIQNNMQHVLSRQIKNHFFLKHQNIIDFYGMFQEGGHIYLIIQYCTDGDLFHMLKRRRRISDDLSESQIVSLIRQLSQAVYSMHNQYIMHRDIKPQNIFLTMGNLVKIGDLGCSVCYSNSQLRNTQCGTPLYLAPELIGKGQYSQSVDIWAIGVLAYQLLSGYSPFTINSAKDLTKVVNQQIDFEYIDNEQARDFVMKLLQKDVEKRYQIQDVLDHPFLAHKQEDEIGYNYI